MPLLATRGAASVQGFGLFGRVKVLTTYTFPVGTSTWTAPSGVNLLASAVGKGADGTSDFGYVASGNSVYQQTPGYSGPQPAYLQWSNVAYYALDYLNTINAAGSGPVTLTTGSTQYVVSDDNTWDSIPNGYVTSGRSTYFFQVLTDIIWVRGSASIFTQGAGATSGNVIYNSNPPFAFIGSANLQATVQGAAGASTTGFSLTFPGGTYTSPTGNPAPTTTFNNVSVTPGTTYTIVNNGALTITYYV
jgi:hypothetical protein